ncbi:hypothetical protein DICPUDRAFT_152837 [Dictyostelium purpureum]|uniref:Uncharacterized protein n=1 Tax=Dictyostelium purpureum TaxID=5786 RepID=F0ZME3_DICPU|nr:uncharacterized protein DICPUDRAFT_152837 [Dictyostelium purpureum]EGC34885.1 hypothetical protein DICPUDRAFT_152837 [Dictyostelium purpureum]|eukprot:XP_003288577.1 hypothetical protein DICPUDRAFT_152837 [Dictyostelium purpureum]
MDPRSTGVSVNAWSCVTSRGVGYMTFIDGNTDSETYIDNLYQSILKRIQQIIANRGGFTKY